jgi:hypothetical protein
MFTVGLWGNEVGYMNADPDAQFIWSLVSWHRFPAIETTVELLHLKERTSTMISVTPSLLLPQCKRGQLKNTLL